VWRLDRRAESSKSAGIGGRLVSLFALAPYFLIAGILFFYRE